MDAYRVINNLRDKFAILSTKYIIETYGGVICDNGLSSSFDVIFRDKNTKIKIFALKIEADLIVPTKFKYTTINSTDHIPDVKYLIKELGINSS